LRAGPGPGGRIWHARLLPERLALWELEHMLAALLEVLGGQAGQRHQDHHAQSEGVRQLGGDAAVHAATRRARMRLIELWDGRGKP